MLYEFAIEPECFTSFENARYLLDQLGVHHARVVGSVQKVRKWRSAVLRACEIKGDKRTLEFLVKRLKFTNGGFVFPRKELNGTEEDWDGNLSWSENLLASHNRFSFQGLIFADDPPNTSEELISIARLSGDWKPWDVGS